MIVRHLLIHVGIAAAAVLALPLFGVAWSTALFVGLVGGCLAMALGHGRHGGHTGRGEPGDQRHDHVDGSGPVRFVRPNTDHDANE